MFRGRSSGVEHNLAKVGVVSSNLIARSTSVEQYSNWNFKFSSMTGLFCVKALDKKRSQ